MRINNTNDANMHRRQEAEANAFAIELLAPLPLIIDYLRGPPDLQNVWSMFENLKISKAAAARRYISLHDESLALVFSHQNRFQFADRKPQFPWIDLTEGQLLPGLPAASGDVVISDIEEGDDHDWFGKAYPGELLIQTLYQQDGYAITLLQLNGKTGDGETDTREDTFDRFMRYSSDSRD